MVVATFIDGGNKSTRSPHRPVASHSQTLSHNVVSSVIRTHNVKSSVLCYYVIYMPNQNKVFLSYLNVSGDRH